MAVVDVIGSLVMFVTSQETYQFSRVLHTHQVIKSGATSNSHVQQGIV